MAPTRMCPRTSMVIFVGWLIPTRGKRRLLFVSAIFSLLLLVVVFWDRPSSTIGGSDDDGQTVGGGSPRRNLAASDVDESGLAAMLALVSTVDGNANKPQAAKNTSSLQEDVERLRRLSNVPRYVPRQILVHLDFKGAPPKLKYLRQLLSLFKRMGATGLLVEYEDMFPYWGPLTPLSAKNAFTYDDVKTLLAIAEENGLQVIPLVQTIGHMEFVLKSGSFKHLREVPSYPQALCPSRQESLFLVKSMIDQTIALHPGIKALHIGCDEVFHLGMCRSCHQRLVNNSKEYSRHPRSFLFLQHVREVAQYVKKNYGIQPLVWDDMFRNIPTEYIVQSGVHGGLVEPMVWSYSDGIDNYIGSDLWAKYAEVFPNVWTAGAFKGAFGETMYLPDVYQHVVNTAEWLNVMRRESPRFVEMRGFVLTGWQRYDHFSVLCELLPSAVPSLAATLLTAEHGLVDDDVMWNVTEALQCPERTNVPTLDTLSRDHQLVVLASCDFPGNSAFHVARTLHSLKRMVAKHLHKMVVTDGWLVPYVWRRNFANPFRVRGAWQRTSSLIKNAAALKKNAAASLTRYFHDDAIDEWIEQQIEPLVAALQFANAKMGPLLEQKQWPQRPLTS